MAVAGDASVTGIGVMEQCFVGWRYEAIMAQSCSGAGTSVATAVAPSLLRAERGTGGHGAREDLNAVDGVRKPIRERTLMDRILVKAGNSFYATTSSH